jgi:prephenate dehydratase
MSPFYKFKIPENAPARAAHLNKAFKVVESSESRRLNETRFLTLGASPEARKKEDSE